MSAWNHEQIGMKELSKLMNLWEYWLQLFILAVFFLPGQNSFCKDVPLNEAKHIGLSFINHKMAAGATCDSLALQDGFNNNGLGDVSSDLGENLFVFGIYPGPGFIIAVSYTHLRAHET